MTDTKPNYMTKTPSTLSAAKNMIKSLRQQVTRLQKATSDEERAKAQEYIDRLIQANSGLKRQLQASESELRQERDRLSDFERDYANSQARVEELENRIESLLNDLTEMTEARDDAMRRATDWKRNFDMQDGMRRTALEAIERLGQGLGITK